ncbi:NAD(P)/FAD-dependent oxidoreductase [Dactylosporangium sp. CA-233914]|uniref:NAD(P)/FAD-dependent oxidoreductase n=1 Tax=Dactylosporangium sp. CA-233914 TaxID=3239934 RepID=UPI003D8D8E2D
MTAPGRVVIVGGGVAGVSTAAALRAGGYAGDLVLVERSEFPYDRPPLSKAYLAGAQDLEQIALQRPDWYVEQRVTLVGRAEVVDLKPSDAQVRIQLADGTVSDADQVVLASGGRPAVPPIPGIDATRDARRLHVLRDADDADRLRAALRPGTRLLVVGGGLIGAESASTARELGCHVTMVDPVDPPLIGALGPAVAQWLHGQHTDHGVDTVTTVLESLRPTSSGVAARLRGESADREFDAVLVGVGMMPHTGLAAAARLEVDRGVLVDNAQVTSHPRILAVGDCARMRGHDRSEHWEAAQLDGRRAAATILGVAAPAPTAPWWWSDRYGRHVEGVGQLTGPDAGIRHIVRGKIGPAPFAVFAVRDDRIVGAVAIDDSQALRAARRLIDRAVAVDPARLADTGTDLRKLLRG